MSTLGLNSGERSPIEPRVDVHQGRGRRAAATLRAFPEMERIVTGFTFTAQDLRSAPDEVRRWLVSRIESDLVGLTSAPPVAPPMQAPPLAACTPEEALGVLDLLKGDFAAMHVLLELARDEPQVDAALPLHAISIGALMRNTRLDERRLVSCLQAINRAFQEVRRDPEATLFGFDQAEHLYVHEVTYRSLRGLWRDLTRPHAPTEAMAAAPVAWPAASFRPRQLGPSEDIATHQQH